MTGQRLGVVALAAVAALALLGCVVSGYASRALFDPDQFAARATVALDDDAVANEAA